MARAESLPLVVGLPGPVLTDAHADTLRRVLPAGVILFARNIVSSDQVRELTDRLAELEPRPFVAVDLEGGRVNRLRTLWGELPSARAAARGGRKAVGALGESVGAACRSLGIHLDLAPVVDLERPNGALGREERCFGADPERVATLAKVFHAGLEAWGVGACLKHFPGLGAVAMDTHVGLPALPPEEPLDPHLQVFHALTETIPVVMIAHVIAPGLGEEVRPASLSRAVIERAVSLPGHPVVLSDDLEMGALERWGDLPDRVEAALRARNHGALVCHAFERLPELVEHLEKIAESEPTFASRLEEMASRLGTLRRDLCQHAASVPAPDDDTVAALWETARRAVRA